MKTDRSIHILLILVTLSANLLAQVVVETHATTLIRQAEEHLQREYSYEHSTKCGTHLVAAIRQPSIHEADASKGSVEEVLARPQMQKSRMSPNGKFRIHYDTTGFHLPAMLNAQGIRIPASFEQYIDSVARTFENSLSRLTAELGYASIPQDGTRGGGPEYDVYVQEVGSGIFGITYWSDEELLSSKPNEKYSTYILIDNDYQYFRTSGMDGLRVTSAHELFHAIQIGSYGIWTNIKNSDFYFYELSATWIEDVIYPQVKDYLFDVPTYFKRFRDFRNRSMSFLVFDSFQNPGYERAIFGHYLEARFGRSLMKNVWQRMRQESFLSSMETELNILDSDLISEYVRFNQWNYFTGDRTMPTKYYKDGNLYPRMVPNISTTYDNFSATISSEAFPFSSQYFTFAMSTDTITAILVNVELDSAKSNVNAVQRFDIKLSLDNSKGAVQRLSYGAQGALFSTESSSWRIYYLSSKTLEDSKRDLIPFPSPFRLSSSAYLTIPVDDLLAQQADVLLYSSSMDRVYSGTFPVRLSLGHAYATLPSQELRKSISSGVYFVVVKTEKTEQQWKVAIIQ